MERDPVYIYVCTSQPRLTMLTALLLALIVMPALLVKLQTRCWCTAPAATPFLISALRAARSVHDPALNRPFQTMHD